MSEEVKDLKNAEEIMQPETQEHSAMRKIAQENRPLLNIALVATLLAIGTPAAAKTDPDLSQNSPYMQNLYGGHEKPTTYLRANELGVLNSAMTVLFKQYTHFALWAELLSKGKKASAEHLLNSIMDINTRHNYWYQKGSDGEITIRDRSEYSSILVRIKHGLITEINGFKVDYRNINKPHIESKQVEGYIGSVGPKIQYPDEPTVETGHPPIITEAEKSLYSLYNMELPFRVQKLLELKGNLTPEEARVKGELDTLLAQHPKSAKDMRKSMEEFRRTRNTSKLKRPMIFITKRATINAGHRRQEATPNGMFEIVRTANASGRAWQTIAVVSMDGQIMERRNGKWEKSDNRTNSFGNGTKLMQTGKLLTTNIRNGFNTECHSELQQYRNNIMHICRNTGPENRGACLARYTTRHQGCVQAKIQKWRQKR